MSEHSVIRAAIVGRLQQVAGIGLVHGYERYAKSDKDFRDLYLQDGQLLGWHVRRIGRREDVGSNDVFTDWEIRGFMALQDAGASELIFDDLYDAICDAWRADPTLGKAVSAPKAGADVVPAMQDSGPVMFAGVLCHSMRLKLTTRTRLFAVSRE